MSEHTSSHYSNSDSCSDIATEPLPPSERRQVNEYMTRRQRFLSDYQRYTPIQNMQSLANHVFDLSENIFQLRNDFTGSRRILDILSNNQHDVNESIKNVGQDLDIVGQELSGTKGGIHRDIDNLRNEVQREMHSIRQETQQGLQGLQEVKAMLSMMMGNRSEE